MDYKTVSLADQVYERLETDILTGKYQQGEILTELRICSDLGISRTPVREALRSLAQEHLVEDCGKGTRVLGITSKDFEDMCTIRLRIEGLAVRGFIRNRTEDMLKMLREVLELQEFYLNKSDPDHMKVMDGRFHEIIYENCGSPILCHILAPLHKKIQKFRRLSIEQAGRAQKSYQEHRAIYEAMAAGDEDLAEKLMSEHVQNAMNTILHKEG